MSWHVITQVDDATVEQEEIGEEADPTGSIQEQDAGDVPIVLLPNAKVIDTPTSRPPPPPAPCPRNNSGNSARQISLLGIDHIRRMDNFEVYLQPTRKNKPWYSTALRGEIELGRTMLISLQRMYLEGIHFPLYFILELSDLTLA